MNLSSRRIQHVQDEHKNYPPLVAFVDISALSADFCTKFYVTVKQSNVNFVTKFVWNMSENDKIMLFQARQPAFLTDQASCRIDW